MSLLTVVGNPRAGSRTLAAARVATDAIADRLGHTGPRDVVDLSAIAQVLFTGGAQAELELVTSASVVLWVSPTYKATYTGLLKAFADRLPSNALAGKAALPVLVMGDPKHALAVETHFRPLLVELGAYVPTPGLALLESDLPGHDALARWADLVAPQIAIKQGALR